MIKKLYTQVILFIAFVLAIPLSGLAQMSFTNQSATVLSDTDFHSGGAMTVADMNGDYLDDIVRLSESKILSIDYQRPDGTFEHFMFGEVSEQGQWAMCIADVDNDGYGEVMCGDYDNTKLIKSNADGTVFTSVLMPGPEFFAQGSNFADINNDGFLDAFVCDDNAESRIFGNNGDGTFAMADDWIDMATTPASDNSGNYGSIWTDFDNDGDTDLYIAKCRQGVGDPTDPRRINALFVNDGNNNYTEMAAEYGVKIGHQSWTADFNDIDNDGDMDIFLTNHDHSNQILENDGTGHYKEITESAGITATNFPLQGVMRDMDNDGFVDIVMAGSDSKVYYNNGDKTFTEMEDVFPDLGELHSFGIGDLNHDGSLDLYASYGSGYINSNPDQEDVIWMNDGNDNNFFVANLKGVMSNLGGVGARVEIYGDWGVQVREVRAGESYGIMNSLNPHFGLGQATAIEKLVVKWPSGIIDVIENPQINSFLEVIEGDCMRTESMVITSDGATTICEGTSLTLTAPTGTEYLWSNGATTATITVDEPGAYNVLVKDNGNCFDISQNLIVSYQEEIIPTVASSGDLIFCNGDAVTLTASEADAYTWSVNGATTQSIEVTEPGEYFVTTPGVCGDNTSSSLVVETLSAALPVVTDVQIAPGGDATLTATGDILEWYDAEVGGTLLGEGLTLEMNAVATTTSVWVQNQQEFPADEFYVGPAQHQGNQYSGSQWNSGVFFDAFKAFTLKSVLVYTDTEGERIIELKDANEDVIQSIMLNIPATGDNGFRINLNFEVPVGTGFFLTTNADQNHILFNDTEHDSPRLRRSSAGVNYNDSNFSNADYVDITGSSLGSNRFYYFYDWEVQPEGTFCYSDRVEAQILVVSTNNIADTPELELFPNPSQGQVNLVMDFDGTQKVDLQVTDLAGRMLYQENLGTINSKTTHSLNLEDLAKGVYILRLSANGQTYHGKFVIQ